MFDFFKKRKLKSLLRKNNRQHVFLNMETIQSVLVLFETSDYEAVDLFVEKLLKKKKSVDGYAFRVKNDAFDYSETNYKIIGSKENSEKSGSPCSELLKQLKIKHYDVVIDLTIKENFSLQYILAVANTTMTVGLKKNKLPFYDFSISKLPKTKGSESSQVSELIKSINFYLKTIKGKET
jgi:hypothetical protein